ncbi:MAG TPA: type II toxin-antitoxin system Phd/YefM family antitoxin [Rhodopila sp.]|jgi:antitoxin (DNA-binding transcriptional repressor) of toxin-antitoxin stability system|nr:type II toxin-antitoxin system Phd/YefM family antitoxin [Rhodopila sp.]
MPTTQTISASEFKAKCLNILDRLASHELDRVIITKRGKTVAILTPPDQLADAVRNIHGFMRGSVIIADDVDLTDPILDEPFTAENGDLHG